MPDRLTAALREFSRTFFSPYDLDELLDRLLRHTTSALDATGAGIMLEVENDRLGFVAATSVRIEQVEQVQADAHEGVCYAAYQSGRVLAVDDLHGEDRWPTYTRRVLEQGMVAVIGVPLIAWGQTIGVLNVYRDKPLPWSDEDLDACEIVATLGAAYILNSTQSQAQRRLAEDLRAALRSRGTIERAKGIIMGRTGVDADTAFERLRQMSMDQNRKLRDVAADIIDE
jgi:GAF domain-containing protein